MKQNKITLKNGIKLIHYLLPATNSVTVCALFKTGSVNESKKDHGMAHFLEHIIFDGSKSYPDVEATHILLEQLGVIDNAWTFKNITNYWMKSPKENIKRSTEILFDRIFNPLITKDAVTQEKAVITEEIKMGLDDPWRVTWKNLCEHLFKGTPLEHQVIGTVDSVNSFSQPQIRNFYNKNYTTDTLYVWIGGDISFSQAKELIGQKKTPSRKTIRTSLTPKKIPRNPSVVFTKMDVKTDYVMMGFDGFEFDNKKIDTAFLANYILGGGRGSHLYNELLIKRSLAINADTELVSFTKNGIFVININSEVNNTAKAVSLTIDKIQDLAKGNFSTIDITRGKNMILADYVKLQESSDALGQSSGFYNLIRRELLSSSEINFDEILDKLRNIKKNDLKEVFSDLFVKNNFSISIVGPDPRVKKDIKELLQKSPLHSKIGKDNDSRIKKFL